MESSSNPGDGLGGVEAVQAALESVVPGGPLISYLVDQMPAVQRHKAEQMLTQMLQLVP